MQPQQLPHTSRVNDKILEYYAKFGRDRDLEKFMRLYSPANTASTRSRSSGSSSCEDIILGIRRLFEDARQARHVSCSSMPNINLEECEGAGQLGVAAGGDVHIPICVEQGVVAMGDAVCVEMTPPKPPPTTTQQQQQQIQTPESIGKSHKRLEWDSLGDVGYKKSMSTSNISLLERSLLRELFHEHSSTSAASCGRVMNASEGDLKRLHGGGVQHTTDGRTPPLASSTLMETPLQLQQRNTGTKPKVRTHNQSTSTSASLLKQQQHEKYAQTSVQRPSQFATQQVQVNMSSTTTTTSACASTSAMGSSATPSSFEYYSSRSSNSTSMANSSDHFQAAARQRSRRVPHQPPSQQQQQQHPFVAEINELLAQRKALTARNGQNNKNNNNETTSSSSAQPYDACVIEQLHETIKQALDENKENSCAHATQLLRSPQLDLGVQLLCSLIDARSLTSRRKKQLVREIVKRISRMGMADDNEDSGELAASSAAPASRRHSSGKSSAKAQRREMLSSHSDVSAAKKPSPPETSAKALAALALRQASEAATENEKRQQANKEIQTESTTTTTTSKKTLNVDKSVGTETQSPLAASARTVNSTSTATTATTTTTSSKELITQKAANESNTDTEHGVTMREWLNPMTQSEIEYEEKKKRVHAQTTADKRRPAGRARGSKERVVQLNWIDNEIERLESLRHLLLLKNGDASTAREQHKSPELKTKAKTTATAKREAKIYDTVYSDTNASTHDHVAVIIEESNAEDVHDDDDKIKAKRSKERKRETQIIYDKPATEDGRSRYRTIRETITTTREKREALSTDKDTPGTAAAPVKQRSKIATPISGGASTSNDSESVGSFVQQRKREFLEQYKNKRKSHQQALQQQQQQQRERYQRSNTLAAIYGHYAVPHAMLPPSHTYPMAGHRNVQHYAAPMPPPPPPPPPHATHSLAMTASLASLHGHQQQYSSSSLLCVSSEMSIPMGTPGTSSSATTTHQYEHMTTTAAAAHTTAATGIGIQTTNSLMRSQPIFGRREQPGNATVRVAYGTTAGHVPASVQVKPKPIAYVIHFDEGHKATATSTTTTTSNEDTSTAAMQQQHMPVVRVEAQDALTLQQHLARARPQFLAQVKQRKAILNQIQTLRQEREREMRDIVENTSFNSLERNLQRLPPPPTKQVRVFATREMKAMTNKKVANLPEVLMRKQREREDKRRMGNRVLREVFNRRLQRRVRSGKLSLNHSRTVI